jgi:hypothetical protein
MAGARPERKQTAQCYSKMSHVPIFVNIVLVEIYIQIALILSRASHIIMAGNMSLPRGKRALKNAQET